MFRFTLKTHDLYLKHTRIKLHFDQAVDVLKPIITTADWYPFNMMSKLNQKFEEFPIDIILKG